LVYANSVYANLVYATLLHANLPHANLLHVQVPGQRGPVAIVLPPPDSRRDGREYTNVPATCETGSGLSTVPARAQACGC
jgi:hypothetical protein